MSNALTTLTKKIAARFDMGDGTGVTDILKATAFKVRDGQVSDNQMAALLVIANQYGLNPFTKEIYAYPDKSNGIVPVVGVDGWGRIINEHPQLDGIEFRYSDEVIQHKGKTAHTWIECVITRKDRKAPIVIREYFDEVVRNLNFATPWDTHPKRMHRHKALIQCSRVAFGFAGIYDQDEAERILEKDITPTLEPQEPPTLPIYSDADFEKNLPAWRELIASGKKTAERIIAMIESKATLTDEQKQKIANPAAAGVTYAQVAEKMNNAQTVEDLQTAADFIRDLTDETQQAELNNLYAELFHKFE